VQTLGVTSLTLTVVGYFAGRLREARDPQAALTPLSSAPPARPPRCSPTRSCSSCSASRRRSASMLLRQIVLGVVVNTIIALPVWALVRRMFDRRPARGSAPPAAARVNTTGGLSPLSSHGRCERLNAASGLDVSALEPGA